jgi:hypothetical protein
VVSARRSRFQNPRRVTQRGGRVITHHHVASLLCTTTDRTPTTVSMTPAAPAETTGEIVLTWGPDGPAVTAPDRAAVPALELFGMHRVPGDPRAVELPGGIRYLIGAAHRRWRGAVYLHRVPR